MILLNSTSAADFESIVNGIIGLSSIGFSLFFFIIGFISFLISVILYILESVGLYKAAQTAGFPNPWLAWIPICNMYVLAVLPASRTYTLFGKLTAEKRSIAFWIYLAAIFFGGTVIGIISGVLSIIPILGALIAGLLPLAFSLALSYMKWRFYYDYLCCFKRESNAMLISIISLLFAPLFPIMLFIMRNDVPEYGAGNFEAVSNGPQDTYDPNQGYHENY